MKDQKKGKRQVPTLHITVEIEEALKDIKKKHGKKLDKQSRFTIGCLVKAGYYASEIANVLDVNVNVIYTIKYVIFTNEIKCKLSKKEIQDAKRGKQSSFDARSVGYMIHATKKYNDADVAAYFGTTHAVVRGNIKLYDDCYKKLMTLPTGVFVNTYKHKEGK